MRNCATPTTRFDAPTNLALEVAFDGGKLTSNGELTWLSKTVSELGLCEKIAKHVPEWRRGCLVNPQTLSYRSLAYHSLLFH